MEEDDDDLYAPTEHYQKTEPDIKPENVEAMDEDEDEDTDESDSDIEIVTEQKEVERPEPAKSVRTPLAITKPETTSTGRASPAIKTSTSATPPPSKPGSSYPALKTSTLDIDNKPIHEASGKPITEVDIDNDIGPDDKPWRIPGSDQTDYFNYGFDEFTWAAYCMKQTTLRSENKEQKKAMGDFQNMFNGAPAGPAASANPATAMMPGFPGDIPPDMQAAMQAMMASGMDPSQMDLNSFMQMMGGTQGFGGQGVQNMGMGGYDAYGAQQQQQQQQQQQLQQQPQQQVHGGGRGNRRGRGRW